MSTRSAIILKQSDGSFAGIYCHFDGYVEGVGAELNKHYQDRAKVAELISNGDASCIGADIGSCEFYARDRGEPMDEVRATTGPTVESVESKIGHNGYVYVFGDSGWTVNGKPLAGELAKAEAA